MDLPGGIISGVWGVNGTWNGVVESPLRKRFAGFWAGQRLAGTTAGQFRALGGIQTARYQNLISDDSGSWPNGIGATVTAGQEDPFGGTGAVKIEGDGLFRLVSYATTGNAVGDRWFFSCAIRKDDGIPALELNLFQINQVNDNGPWNLQIQGVFTGDGEWQWLTGYFTLTNAAVANNNTLAYVDVNEELTLFQPTLIRVPASAGMSENEAAEFCNTLRPQSAYLTPGTSGTNPGSKFIAHAGLGTNAKYVIGGSPGEITLGSDNANAVELFDAAGNSLGVIRLKDFTVNE